MTPMDVWIVQLFRVTEPPQLLHRNNNKLWSIYNGLTDKPIFQLHLYRLTH